MMDTQSHISLFLTCIFCCWNTCVFENPCENYLPFPDASKRVVTNRYKSGGELLSDAYLPTDNYYGIPGYKLVGRSPSLRQCGTLFPVWVKNLPDDGDVGQEVHLTACLVAGNNCATSMKVIVHFCSTFQIYKLEHTPTASSYCLETASLNTTVPTFSPETHVEVRLDNSGDDGRTEFLCVFNSSTEEPDLYYVISWYIDKKHFYESSPMQWSFDIYNKTMLNETILEEGNITHAGFYVQCGARASYEGSPSGPVGRSEEQFIGISIEPTHVIVSDDQTAAVYLKTSIPFVCGRFFHGDQELCDIHVNVHHEKANDGICNGNPLSRSECRVVLKSTNTTSEPLVINTDMTNVPRDKPVISRLYLQTRKKIIGLPFWQEYMVGFVTVTLIKKKSAADYKECKVWGEPHMKTFDGSQYENHLDGTFILYRHATLPVEVQIKTRRVVGTYTCAVAVRAGRTVYIVDICGKRKYGFYICDDGTDIITVKEGGKRHRFGLPTGTEVQVDSSGTYMNVQVHPAYADASKAEGLCGALSRVCTDDFKLRNKSTDLNRKGCTSRGSYVDTFSDSWKTPEDENLFNEHVCENLKPWTDNFVYCSCDKQTENAHCSANRQVQCNDNAIFVTRHPFCNKTIIRRRRSAFNTCVDVHMDKGVEKRSVPQWSNGWTREKATQTCQAVYNRSVAVSVCGELIASSMSISDYIWTCIEDIKLTGTDKFLYSSLDSLKSSCMHHVEIHPETQEKKSNDTPSIFETVMDAVCPSDCNDRGNCTQGLCICEHPYGGADCSMDLRLPPVIYGLLDDGYCDLQEDDCTQPLITGEYFIDSDKLKCRMTSFTIDNNGRMVKGKVSYTKPIIQYYGEIACPAPHGRKGRSVEPTHFDVARGYLIAVTNNGHLYSKESVMVVYNSGCQLCEIKGRSVTCKFSTDSCIAQGVCVLPGKLYPGDDCFVCDTSGSRQWKPAVCHVEDKSKEVEDDTPQRVPYWVIGVSVGAVVLIIVVVVALLFCNRIRKRRRAELSSSKTPVYENVPIDKL